MPGQDRRFAEHVRGRSLYFAKVFVNDGRDVRYTRVTPTVAPDPTDGHLYFDFGYPIRVVDFHSVEVWAVSDRRRWEMERLVDARVVDRRQTIDGDLLHFALH